MRHLNWVHPFLMFWKVCPQVFLSLRGDWLCRTIIGKQSSVLERLCACAGTTWEVVHAKALCTLKCFMSSDLACPSSSSPTFFPNPFFC